MYVLVEANNSYGKYNVSQNGDFVVMLSNKQYFIQELPQNANVNVL